MGFLDFGRPEGFMGSKSAQNLSLVPNLLSDYVGYRLNLRISGKLDGVAESVLTVSLVVSVYGFSLRGEGLGGVACASASGQCGGCMAPWVPKAPPRLPKGFQN